MKKFNQFINESVRDKMTPKPKEDMIKSLMKLSPYEALATAKKYELTDAISDCLQRTKPLEDKLYKDIKKFNKSNLDNFLPFISKWVKNQGGSNYALNELFSPILENIRNISEDEYEDYEGDEIVESIYSDKTIESFKQLVVNYAIDELNNKIEEEDGPDYEDEWGDLTPEEVNAEIEAQERLDYENELLEEERKLKKKKAEDERIEKLKKKEEEEKKPINKIKKFLGFNEKI